jgi:hypothetical protein
MAFLIPVMIATPALKGTTFAQTPDKRPNFLVIVGDDFGYSFVPGHKLELNPVLPLN